LIGGTIVSATLATILILFVYYKQQDVDPINFAIYDWTKDVHDYLSRPDIG
jgi:hypothetical protein